MTITMTPICEICGRTHPTGTMIFDTSQAYRCFCPKHLKFYKGYATPYGDGWILEIL